MGSVLGKISEELPRHEVLAKTAAYEIRRYAPCVVAETTYVSRDGMFSGDQGGSFMKLAKYIGVMAKPQNAEAAPIAMTSPVLMERAPGGGGGSGGSGGSGDGDHGFKMCFFLPASRFRKAADAPTPTSPEVAIRDVPARVMAAKTFSGNLCQSLIAEKDAELRGELSRDGVKPAPGATASAAGYNPPWTPWFLKTTEVMLEVQGY
jgi:hypothetical protein